LRLFHHSDEAQAALDGLESVTLEYLTASQVAKTFHAIGQPPEAIDDKAKVDDTPALEGLAVLLAKTDLATTNYKPQILSELRRALGYGGMVHQVKTYVIRKDAAQFDKISAALAEAEQALTRYQALGVSPDEQQAVNTLRDLLTTVANGTATIRDMSTAGQDARAIDAAVKWDDGPALEALSVLDQAILAETVAAGQSLSSKISNIALLSMFLSVALTLTLPLLGLFIHRQLRNSAVAPARAISDAVQKLAQGDTSVDVSDYEAETEIGAIAASCGSFTDALKKNEEMSRQARDDAEAQKRMARETAALMEEQTQMQVEVGNKAQVIQREVTTIAKAAEDLSRRTEQQAATLVSSAASLNELAASVENVSGSAQSAREQMERINTVSETCSAILNDAIGSMEKIVSSSSEVAKVTEVIEQIAFQTNLLALNAGVEAARAGSAGRGFAVVATEVLALAQRSAEAASEIKEMISTSTSEIETGSAKISKAGDSFGEIANMIEAVKQIAETVAHSTQEQSSGIQDLNASIANLEKVTQSNAAMFEETAASTNMLSTSVDDLVASSATSRAPAPAMANPEGQWESSPAPQQRAG
jgi:methyl-accepting chemotaxis protein